MKKFIITTTINEPTEAIQAFDAMLDWTLVVVADTTTPKDYKLERGIVLTVKDQENLDKELSDLIGWRCIQRRNFGFLYAWKEGAGIIATVDDDNIPLPGWGQNLLIGDGPQNVNYYKTNQPIFDPLYVTNYPHLWHRGFPLPLLHERETELRSTILRDFEIQADFWNGDPDVDAICRMVYGPKDCVFMDDPFPFCSNAISPFNSQNTFLLREVLPYYFMFPNVGRFDDIFAAYHMMHQGFDVVYGKPSVTQKRNAHDVMLDFKNEMTGHVFTLPLIESKMSVPDFIGQNMSMQGAEAYEQYKTHFE